MGDKCPYIKNMWGQKSPIWICQHGKYSTFIIFLANEGFPCDKATHQ